MTNLVEKGWGYEEIFASNAMYCGKFLCFNENSQFSMHFHADKHETWYVLEGEFIVEWIDRVDASVKSKVLKQGDTWENEPLLPHRLRCGATKGKIVEVSTADSTHDNYRVFPGDYWK